MEKDQEFEVFELKEADGKRHSALRIPKNLPPEHASEKVLKSDDVLNIFMGDVSGSMYRSFPLVVTGWQKHVQHLLMGTTKIYVFASYVSFIRNGHELRPEDNLGGGTNITAALHEVRKEVEETTKGYINIFFVTDGGHNGGDPLPETEIVLMNPPPGKTVSVYLLGVGQSFPVNYSVDIRSHMHNGNANIPTLFWAQQDDDIIDQVKSIGDELSSGLVKLQLNTEGYVLPGLDKTTTVHLGEWLYFDEPPEALPSISIGVNDGEMKPIIASTKLVTLRQLLDGTFRQWNSVLIQQHRKKAHVPIETFDLMDSLFGYYKGILDKSVPTGNDIKSRLTRKQMKSEEVEYQTLRNQSKSVIDVEGKYRNELELAEIILKSTVTNRKYDVRNLKLKGHGQDEYVRDITDFKKIYGDIKAEIQKLPPPSAEESCRVLMTSTLADLQDPDFEEILNESKFDLLKTFTMTGIPIYAPVRDASQFNPWTLVIKNILVTPFTILSQQVLEHTADMDSKSEDKDVLLQKDNEQTRFNAIIPLIPAGATKVLKPLVHSNIYTMMCTFCILKNPHILDYVAHLAALACAWMTTVRLFPKEKRPEFAVERLASIDATAKLYMGRSSLTRFVDTLISNPKQALMTESTEEFDGKSLKCESLVKPAFLMYLAKDKFTTEQRVVALELLLYEYIGRCLSSYKFEECEVPPYTEFFCEQLTEKEKRKTWLSGYCKQIIDAYQANEGSNSFLQKFFTLDDLISTLKPYIRNEVKALTKKITEDLNVSVNMKKIYSLRSYASCGDVRWTSFKALAHELDIPEEKINEAFDPKKVMAYVYGSFQYKNSRDRLSKDVPATDGVLKTVTLGVLQENTQSLRSTVYEEVKEFAINKWKNEYKEAHKSLVMPMTKQEVIEAAQQKGIQVTPETFQTVYRYNEKLGILRNACQISQCPHYLQPHNNFNQHVSVEREEESFPHSLHLVSHKFCGQGLDTVIKEVVSGKHAGTRKRRLPTPPVPNSLQALHKEMESLVIHYAKCDVNVVVESTAEHKGNEEDGEEMFYDAVQE